MPPTGFGATTISLERFDAVLFDVDGVLTATARLHAACWKQMFDDFLRQRSREAEVPFAPFDIATDYRRHVDGKLRDDGVRSFLSARGIGLPDGDPDDPPDAMTVCGLGNRKNALVGEMLDRDGVDVYEGSITWAREIRGRGLATAVVSASKNCRRVLEAAGIADLFDERIDGLVADELGLAGKPAPDTFLEAARRLGVTPERAVVVEDAVSGVQAGVAGGFGLVIGVDRTDDRESLREAGADLVVEDLAELSGDGGES